MELANFLDRNDVLLNVDVTSKKHLLQHLADHVGSSSLLDAREVFSAILQREKLGSTAVGAGVAIPHGKFRKLDRIVGCLAKLETPIDFDSIDGQPVDIVFLLLAPEDAGADHLKALSRIARALRDPARTAGIRAANTPEALYSSLIEEPTSNAA
ncbi:MAG: PTS sugar transporter subunit IIA [Pseudomonadota bacterium]